LQPASVNAAHGSVPVDPSEKLTAATQAATAAVAAAMAKLPPGQTNGNAVDNLTRKVNEMRTSDHVRAPRQPGRDGGFANRGARGGRGGARNVAQPTAEVPKTDFDFESANAKFNKEDLVKEAIAGSPLTENPPALSPADAEVPVSGYNKKASFFDNISSESKDRMEAGNSKPGGREWRGEEQKKNVETFGQGSVDNGYRGGYRGGRGRGRGRGNYRGRGYNGNGQPRGGSSFRGRDAQTFA
jgi:protein LSM14